MMPKSVNNHFADSHKHLAKLDPRLKALIARVGPCTLRVRPNPFGVLAGPIVSQQISTKAAESISRRLRGLCGRGGLRPGRIAEMADEELRAAGLSRSKVLSMRSLSQFFLDNPSISRRLKSMSDAEVIETLIPI